MSEVPCRVRTLYQFGPWDSRVEVEFCRLKQRNPGWTHRVAVGGVLLYWLSEDFRPSVKTARFFFDKYMACKDIPQGRPETETP